MKFVENIKNQDKRQKILLMVFVTVLMATVVNVYFSFFAKPKNELSASGSGSVLAPLEVNTKILDSEVFNNLKSN